MSFHCIVWYCMVLYCIRFFCTVSHCHLSLLQRAGELPRSASSHFGRCVLKLRLPYCCCNKQDSHLTIYLVSIWVVTFKSFPSCSEFSFCCADLSRAVRIFLRPQGPLGIPIVSVCCPYELSGSTLNLSKPSLDNDRPHYLRFIADLYRAWIGRVPCFLMIEIKIHNLWFALKLCALFTLVYLCI